MIVILYSFPRWYHWRKVSRKVNYFLQLRANLQLSEFLKWRERLCLIEWYYTSIKIALKTPYQMAWVWSLLTSAMTGKVLRPSVSSPVKWDKILPSKNLYEAHYILVCVYLCTVSCFCKLGLGCRWSLSVLQNSKCIFCYKLWCSQRFHSQTCPQRLWIQCSSNMGHL